jgi:hypothetical protein
VLPEHWAVFVAEHCPQAPDAWQAGVVPPHSPSPPQPRQVCVPPSQMGVAPLQSALATQRTQVPLAVLQTGVAPTHWVALPAEHCLQAPDAWQAGVVPPHSLSPLQARQVRKAGSQTGFVPPQSAAARQPTQLLVAVLQTGVGPEQLTLLRHWTHVAELVSQTGVAPLQRPMLVAEQAPQAPDAWQTGAVEGQSASAPQPRQACAVPSQIGLVPLQFAEERQATQVFGDVVVRQ